MLKMNRTKRGNLAEWSHIGIAIQKAADVLKSHFHHWLDLFLCHPDFKSSVMLVGDFNAATL